MDPVPDAATNCCIMRRPNRCMHLVSSHEPTHAVVQFMQQLLRLFPVRLLVAASGGLHTTAPMASRGEGTKRAMGMETQGLYAFTAGLHA